MNSHKSLILSDAALDPLGRLILSDDALMRELEGNATVDVAGANGSNCVGSQNGDYCTNPFDCRFSQNGTWCSNSQYCTGSSNPVYCT